MLIRKLYKTSRKSCQSIEEATFNSNLHYAHNENNIKQNHMSLKKFKNVFVQILFTKWLFLTYCRICFQYSKFISFFPVLRRAFSILFVPCLGVTAGVEPAA